MEPKVLNSNDTNTLHPLAGMINSGAGTEDGIYAGPKDKEDEDEEDDDNLNDDLDTDDEYTEDEPLPGEIANPEELDDDDEMA